MSGAPVQVPLQVRVAMAHAVLQRIAEREHVDVLHIKGLAVEPEVGRPELGGTDADVLVRPAHVERFLEALRSRGWRQQSTFDSDSDFGNAVTCHHPEWAYADVHRFFPGIGAPPETAFEELWRHRSSREIGGVECDVPDLAGQSVILLLNAARYGPGRSGAAEVHAIWHAAPEDRRTVMRRLVEELGAEVAFAAATGGLERYRHRRDYDLWRIESRGGTRIERWAARVKAAPSRRDAVRMALRAPLVNVEHLAFLLGHPPTRAEVAREFFARPTRGLAEEWRARRNGRGRGS